MSDHSAIQWTDASWNPVTGCTKVSDGCDHCYAERLTERFHGKGSFAHVTLHPDRLDQPLRWRRPRRVFVNSMSDLFHRAVPDDYIARVFAVMASSAAHTFQVLTKRHGRMRALLSSDTFRQDIAEHWTTLLRIGPSRAQNDFLGDWWPLPNVWVGVSVEDQRWADIRVPALLDTPAAVRFLSCEPLLSAVDLTDCGGINALEQDWVGGPGGGSGAPHPFIDWCIVGGESGPGARPMEIDWARWLIGQCQSADVPVFVKQLGSVWARGLYGDAKGGDPNLWPPDLRIRHYPQPMAVAS